VSPAGAGAHECNSEYECDAGTIFRSVFTGSMCQNVTPRGKEEEEAACSVACDSGCVCPAKKTGEYNEQETGRSLFKRYRVAVPRISSLLPVSPS
jgi:hypothetical protein